MLASAVIVGASILHLANSDSVPRTRVGVKTGLNDLRGVLNDTTRVHYLFREKRINISAYIHCDGADNSKDRIQQTLQNLFERTQNCFLYYSGHGKKGGGYLCLGEDEYISPHEVREWFELYKMENGKLFIILDSCYSGAWKNIAEPGRIYVSAACGEDEVAYDGLDGGLFTTAWLIRNKVCANMLLLPESNLWYSNGNVLHDYYRCQVDPGLSSRDFLKGFSNCKIQIRGQHGFISFQGYKVVSTQNPGWEYKIIPVDKERGYFALECANGYLSFGSQGIRIEPNHIKGDEILNLQQIEDPGCYCIKQHSTNDRILSIGSERPGVCLRPHYRGDEYFTIFVRL